MTTQGLRFNEIEHKFVVGDDFDVRAFGAALAPLEPTWSGSIQVQDRYYLTDVGRERQFFFRHRYDAEIHHLTLKTFGADTEVRVEINLDLGHHAGDQRAQVDAFLQHLGVRWSGAILKDLDVWCFPDCEVVHYRASTEARSVRCVEFEATEKPTIEAALATVERYERATGFDASSRSHLSLLQILFPEVASELAPRG